MNRSHSLKINKCKKWFRQKEEHIDILELEDMNMNHLKFINKKNNRLMKIYKCSILLQRFEIVQC